MLQVLYLFCSRECIVIMMGHTQLFYSLMLAKCNIAIYSVNLVPMNTDFQTLFGQWFYLFIFSFLTRYWIAIRHLKNAAKKTSGLAYILQLTVTAATVSQMPNFPTYTSAILSLMLSIKIRKDRSVLLLYKKNGHL